jgi:hypothetical protein
VTELAALLFAILIPAAAFADPVASSFGTSPFVVAYQPPPEVDHSHRGLTLELSLGGGTTSVDQSATAGSFAIGGWITHDLVLTFRATAVGAFGFVGGSAQYYATRSLWLGAGGGELSERAMDEYGGTVRDSGTGGFLRAGYNLTGSGANALYLAGELQAGQINDQSRAVAFVAIGYQRL